jgi:DNA modification methylase
MTNAEPLAIQYVAPDRLVRNPRNARTHSARQIKQIAESIKKLGFNSPILIGPDDMVLAGHGRLDAAKRLGLASVPTVRLDHMTEAQRRAYALADNKLAELAGWDREILAIELAGLEALDLDFEVTLTGFETAEIDLLLVGAQHAAAASADDSLPEATPGAPVTKAGDLWLLGGHRLLCGDARDPAAYQRLMAGEAAQLIFTDPPYNVAINGNVAKRGKHAEFAMASGEMSEAEFIAFLKAALGLMAANSLDGSIHFIAIDWRHVLELLTAGREVYAELKNMCVWEKSNGGMGSLYRSQHELFLVFKHGSAPHINNVELGRYGRNRTNIWKYAGMSSLGAEERNLLSEHATPKPVALVADAILDCSERGALVLDPFCGSGATIIAAERTGRRARALELEPRFVDLAIRRWQACSGEVARLADGGLSFEEAAERRAQGAALAGEEPGNG